jgi:primosomal protein N' (replication factor Y) (superfamily II helicase)
MNESTLYAAVAVPLPLPAPLVYEVPEAFARLAQPGARARVRVGSRRLVGVIVGLPAEPPEGVRVRPLDAVVDRLPLVPPDLLQLAEFVADYYLAPIGEVLRGMVPTGLPPWGDQRVWLTDAGALANGGDGEEAAVLHTLRDGGRMALVDLQAATGLADLHAVVERLRERNRVVVAESRREGVRYAKAVELASGEPTDLLDRCGRSKPARAVVELLLALGRPATARELQDRIECGPGVVNRLVGLGVLRQFTQIERLGLDAHRTTPAGVRAPIVLRADQEEALRCLRSSLDGESYGAFLIQGVTSSGKTEVYLRAAELCLRQQRGVILLVPEIALVPALAGEVRRRFGDRVAILHSGLSAGERHQEWERIRAGEARVVLGPRSALFAPMAHLGLVVVDEEHDASYKQDATPRYHGRDLALLRAQREGATAVLVSATPSLESRRNVEIGKLTALTLSGRVGDAALPEGILVDLRREGVPQRPGEIQFSERLTSEIELAVAAGDQVILLRNRRGYAPLLLCRACGEDFQCADCGLPRTLHRRERTLRCHYCGAAAPVPRRCPSCDGEALEAIGAGTERVEEEFKALFPGVPVAVLDRDAVRRRGSAAAVLESFAKGSAQVLIGTQMVAKGHHFPAVSLTGVLLADTYLGFPDFRAVERTYSLLVQLAGRAGRGDRPGRVVIQTYHPDHYGIQAALRHDDAAFVEQEMRFRRIFHYPPFSRMVQILARDASRERAAGTLRALAATLHADPEGRGVRILGPAPAPFERLRGQWRFQLLLRGDSAGQLRRLVRRALPAGPASELVVDVDPHELL